MWSSIKLMKAMNLLVHCDDQTIYHLSTETPTPTTLLFTPPFESSLTNMFLFRYQPSSLGFSREENDDPSGSLMHCLT